jgi:hypothetical protein
MTNEEQDAVVGRTLRELKTAEQELSQLLVKFEQHAADIIKLSEEMATRVKRAKSSAESPELYDRLMAMIQSGQVAPGGGIMYIRNYARSVDLDAIDALDREIAQTVDKVAALRKQKQSLGI